MQYYHYLCAAIQGAYTLITVPPDFSRSRFITQPGILFDNYGPYNLKPLLGIEVRLQKDGTVPPEYLKDYARSVRDDWKCREGGILNCLFEELELWNVVQEQQG